MAARMRTKFFDSSNLKRLAKFMLMALGILTILSLTGCQKYFFGMLNPKGLVTYEERKLFFDTLALMLIVVLPVIIMSLTFVFHYQASHRIRDYKPNWSHSYFLESLWWGIPCVIIAVLAIMTWKQSHELDPYKRISGYDQPPMIIHAIALPWKWLFIYPQQNIAMVNYLAIPVGQQIEFWLTTDNVPMSALFIPQLGSQIYAMSGMRTRLHLVANETGVFEGLNTLYNGDGFSDMHFPVHVLTVENMQQWVQSVKASPDSLTPAAYSQLLNPSMDNKAQFFAGAPPDLFNSVVNTYMNSYGPVHPRENQIKTHYQIN